MLHIFILQMILAIVIIMMMSATYYMTPMRRSGYTLSPVALVGPGPVTLTAALFLAAVLRLVGADVKTATKLATKLRYL